MDSLSDGEGMTMRQILTATLVAALLTSACGKSEEQKQVEKAAEDVKKAAEAIGQAAAQAGTAAAAQSTTDVAKAMSGMAAALGAKTADGKRVEPLPFQTLETALPSVSGWEMEKPSSERMTSPVPFSKTEAEFKNGEQSVRVTITDTAAAMMLLMPVRMMVATGYSRET